MEAFGEGRGGMGGAWQDLVMASNACTKILTNMRVFLSILSFFFPTVKDTFAFITILWGG